MKCMVCHNVENNRIYYVREMMFGSRETFRYFQCSRCKCLQIAEIPCNLKDYYPEQYYSFQVFPKAGGLKKFLAYLRDRYAVFGKGQAGRFLYGRHPHSALRSLHPLGVTRNTRILDVGCGSGSFLLSLQALGFRNLLGVDPHNAFDLTLSNGLLVRRMQIDQVSGEKDVIMFHHSFEHIADPSGALKEVCRLLAADGCCIIRIPTVSSYAWEHYGVNWAQIDAPRHLFLHSIESMNFLAAQAGMDVVDIVYDSTSFQFTASEQYVRDIPLEARAQKIDALSRETFISRKQLVEFSKRAAELNALRQGDQAIFYLRKKWGE